MKRAAACLMMAGKEIFWIFKERVRRFCLYNTRGTVAITWLIQAACLCSFIRYNARRRSYGTVYETKSGCESRGGYWRLLRHKAIKKRPFLYEKEPLLFFPCYQKRPSERTASVFDIQAFIVILSQKKITE
jgi:hypothetical protein